MCKIVLNPGGQSECLKWHPCWADQAAPWRTVCMLQFLILNLPTFSSIPLNVWTWHFGWRVTNISLCTSMQQGIWKSEQIWRSRSPWWSMQSIPQEWKLAPPTHPETWTKPEANPWISSRTKGYLWKFRVGGIIHIQAAAPGAQARGRKWSSSVEELLEAIWQLGKTMSCQKG